MIEGNRSREGRSALGSVSGRRREGGRAGRRDGGRRSVRWSPRA